MSDSKRGPLLVLALVLALAVALRAWGVAFGLPYVYHPDEGFEVYRALRLGMGGFDLERTGKGGLYFLLFLEYGVYFVVLRLAGVLHGVGDFARQFATDPSGFWLIGRWTNVVLGTLTVALVAFQGKRMAGWRAGLLGGLFLACASQHVIDSHYVTVDVPMTLFTFLSIVLVVEDVEGRGRWRTWLFAIVAAYAVLNKIPAALLFVPYFLGALLRDGWRGPRGLLRPATLWPPVLAGLLFALANPGIWLSWRDTVDMVRGALSGGGPGPEAPHGPGANLPLFYARVLLDSFGAAGLALAFAGLLGGALRKSRGVALHASFLVAFFLLIAGTGSADLYYERYATPLLPGIALLAALGVDDFLTRRVASPGRANAFAAVVGLLVVLSPVEASVHFDRTMSRTDTRTRALEWMAANAAPGSCVLLEGSMEEPSQLTVPLSPSEANVTAMIDDLRSRDPGKAAFWELKGPALAAPRYRLVTVDHLADWGPLGAYEAGGVEWAILRPERFSGVPDSKYAPSVLETRRRFREALGASPAWQRVQSITNDDGSPGWNLEIWHRMGAPAAGSVPDAAPDPGPPASAG